MYHLYLNIFSAFILSNLLAFFIIFITSLFFIVLALFYLIQCAVSQGPGTLPSSIEMDEIETCDDNENSIKEVINGLKSCQVGTLPKEKRQKWISILESLETTSTAPLIAVPENELLNQMAKMMEKIIKQQDIYQAKIESLEATIKRLENQSPSIKSMTTSTKHPSATQQLSSILQPILTTTISQNNNSPNKKTWTEIIGNNKRALSVVKNNDISILNSDSIKITAKKGLNLDDILKKTKLPNNIKIDKCFKLKDKLILSTNNKNELQNFIDSSDLKIINKFRPRIKIFDIPSCYKDAEITELLATDARIITSHKVGDFRNIVFEIDPIDYKRLLDIKFLVINDWGTTCRITTSNDVQKCGHCQQHGHNTTNCADRVSKKTPVCCGFCAKDHATVDCPNRNNFRERRCINCIKRNYKSVGHSTSWDGCPVKTQFLRTRLTNTLYAL